MVWEHCKMVFAGACCMRALVQVQYRMVSVLGSCMKALALAHYRKAFLEEDHCSSVLVGAAA